MARRPRVSERALQAAIVRACRARGHLVLVTSRGRRICPFCRRAYRGGDGVTPGTPDLWVYAHGRWHGLEVKGTRTPVRPAQQRLADEGLVSIVRTVEEALRAIGYAEEDEAV